MGSPAHPILASPTHINPERLGVLPIKLRGGLGQPPETLHQVPRGSEGMEPVPKWRFHSWNVRFREVPKSRFPSWNVRFREVPKSRFHSWNVRFREVPKSRFHSWNVRFRKVPKWRFHSWNVRSFFDIWYVFAFNMFCVSHSMFLVSHSMFSVIICQSEKQFLSTSCWGFHMGLFFLHRYTQLRTCASDTNKEAAYVSHFWDVRITNHWQGHVISNVRERHP